MTIDTSPLTPDEHTDIERGLTTTQVADAPKNIPAHHVTRTELAITVLRNQCFSFFFILLIVSGVLSLFLGEKVDATIFFIIALVNACIGFIQEFQANESVQALEKLITHTVSVRRNGAIEHIESYDVVKGDIILCEAGDVIVADMIVRNCNDVYIDESVRTGETLPRVAMEGEVLYAGASITQGSIVGQVVGVGKESSLLMYADKISETHKNNTFDTFIHTISTYLLGFTVFCLVIILIVNVLIHQSFTFSEFVLYAISMLVGVVPESLPLIITIILSREVMALSRQKVIVKKLSVLQNLGTMNFLFTDKTGTLTENNVHVKEVVDQNNIQALLRIITESDYERTPMDTVFDKAIEAYLHKNLKDTTQTLSSLTFSPFQTKRGYSVYETKDAGTIIRGQYAMVIEMCKDKSEEFLNACLAYEKQGLRVIAFAKKSNEDEKYILSGVVVFEDQLKKDAIEMYTKIEDSGVDIKILTGDSQAVATSVGQSLESNFEINKVFSMDSIAQDATIELTPYEIYARCSPDDKSTIINAHLTNGVVGFLGDGINDALALKRADIGFVVNNASDVARQASDVILMEKSLNPIIRAIMLSRQAFFHIRTYLLCTLAGNIGTLVSLTLVVLFWQQIPMLPIQILLNNLLTDIPLMFLIGDTIAPRSLQKPIRNDPKRFFKIIFLYAFLSSIFDFIFFFAFYHYDIGILRTGWFVFSVLAELALVFTLRSELSILKAPRISKVLLITLVGCAALAIALPFTPFGKVFSLRALTFAHVELIGIIIVCYIACNEILKKYVFQK